MTKAITKHRTLEECEATIDRGMKFFWEMGEAYQEIKDNGLFKQTHSTWEAYCGERWDLSDSTVNYVIRATGVRHRIAASSHNPGCDSLPVTEKQTRPLAVLPPDQQAPAWKEALDEARAMGKEQPTHDDVKRIVGRYREPPAPPRQPSRTEIAHDAAKRMRERAHSFAMSVDHLLPHLDYLDDDEAQGCAYAVVQTIHRVMAILEENGMITQDVVRGVLGNANPEDGRTEVVAH